MSKRSRGAADTQYYNSAKAENRAVKNRTHKLERHLKNFPNDEQAAQALKKGLTYRRKAPYSKVWTTAKRKYAQDLRYIGLNGHIALSQRKFSTDKES